MAENTPVSDLKPSGVSVEDLNAIAVEVKKASENANRAVEKADNMQRIIDDAYKQISDTKNLTVFGFIVLIFMLGALLIDVISNIYHKDISTSPQPIIIYPRR